MGRITLGVGGPFDDDDFMQSEVAASFLSILAEANPEGTLGTIERTLGVKSKEWLLTYTANRQSIVWALEKIAYWPELFDRAARMLLKLGAAETAGNDNNASGTFTSLFSLGYGRLATSSTAPPERLDTLRVALTSEVDEERSLGLAACKKAMAIHGGIKQVGSEYQGLRKMPDPWMPETYGDIWKAYGDVWGLLVEVLSIFDPGSTVSAYEVLIDAAFGLLQIEFLEDRVLTDLEQAVSDPVLPREKLASLCVSRHVFRDDDTYSKPTRERLSTLDNLITGNTFASKFERYVVFRLHDENMADHQNEENTVQTRIEQLAKTALEHPDEFIETAQLYANSPSCRQFDFGLALGKTDRDKSLVDRVLKLFLKEQLSARLIGGYLRGVKEHDPAIWESSLLELINDEATWPQIGDLIWGSGYNATILASIQNRIASGKLTICSLRNIMYSNDLLPLESPIIDSHVELCLEDGSHVALEIAASLCDQYYCSKKATAPLPLQPIYDLLVHPNCLERESQRMTGYHWGQILKQFLKAHAEEKEKLLHTLFALLSNPKVKVSINYSSAGDALVEACTEFPSEAWLALTKRLESISESERLSLKLFLDADHGSNKISVISEFPQELVLNWVRENPPTNGQFVAEVCAKTFDDTTEGALTRALMTEFGELNEVRRALSRHFWFGSSWGPRSEHYRKKREKAQKWLAEESCGHIKSWLSEYITDLTHQIKRNEIDEEREF